MAEIRPGRPKGSKNRVSRVSMKMLAAKSEEITQKLIEVALNGDVRALEICINRIYPAPKGRSVMFDVPEVKTAQQVDEAIGAALQACARGQITVDEMATLARALRDKAESIAVKELAEQVRELQARYGSSRGQHLRPVS